MDTSTDMLYKAISNTLKDYGIPSHKWAEITELYRRAQSNGHPARRYNDTLRTLSEYAVAKGIEFHKEPKLWELWTWVRKRVERLSVY